MFHAFENVQKRWIRRKRTRCTIARRQRQRPHKLLVHFFLFFSTSSSCSSLSLSSYASLVRMKDIFVHWKWFQECLPIFRFLFWSFCCCSLVVKHNLCINFHLWFLPVACCLNFAHESMQRCLCFACVFHAFQLQLRWTCSRTHLHFVDRFNFLWNQFGTHKILVYILNSRVIRLKFRFVRHLANRHWHLWIASDVVHLRSWRHRTQFLRFLEHVFRSHRSFMQSIATTVRRGLSHLSLACIVIARTWSEERKAKVMEFVVEMLLCWSQECDKRELFH